MPLVGVVEAPLVAVVAVELRHVTTGAIWLAGTEAFMY